MCVSVCLTCGISIRVTITFLDLNVINVCRRLPEKVQT